MAKSDPAADLLKRLQRLEKAYAQLGVLSIRIRAQADVISDLVGLAGALAADLARPERGHASAATPAPAAPKRAAARRAAARPAARRTAATAAPAATAPRPATPRRTRPATTGPTSAG